MSERLTITPLGPYIGAQVSGLDVTRPLSDNQFEQLYHAVLRHQVVFLREQAITPQQQRALALRFGDLHIHPVYPHAEGVEEIIVLDTHNDNPPDNDNWHTDVTFIETPPAGAILAAKLLPEILTGLRIGLGVGWSTLVAAELIAATRGLGFMVQSAGEFLATDVVLAGIAVIAAIAFGLELGLRALQRRLTPWHGEVQ